MAGHVMVLDEHPGIFCLLSTAKQVDVTWVSSEFEAMRKLCQQALDVAVLDITMNGVKWVDLLQTIRLQAPKCEVIVVVPAGQAPMLRQLTQLRVDGVFQRQSEIGALFRRIKDKQSRETRVYEPRGALSGHVDRVLGYLGRHFLETVEVQEIAERFGVSVSHLTHVFGKATGTTIKKFCLQLKIELAKHLLLNGRTTLEELAEQCGFCDASHLSRVFRQFEGCSPGEFRTGVVEGHQRAAPERFTDHEFIGSPQNKEEIWNAITEKLPDDIEAKPIAGSVSSVKSRAPITSQF